MKTASLALALLVLLGVGMATVASAQSVLISELADPRLNYVSDRFLEIYNAGPAAVDLTGWRLVAIGNSADIFTWNLSGQIQPGQALVAGDQTLTVSFPVDFPAEAWSTSNSTWNGKVGDGAKLLDATSTIVDFVVADGTRFENDDYVRVSSVVTPSVTYDPAQWTATPIDLPTQASPGTHTAGSSRPTITAIQTTPAAPTAAQTVSVSADITDSGANLTSAELRWGTSAVSLSNTIAMSLTTGSTWTTTSTISGQSPGTTVFFEIEAFNDVPASTVSVLQSYTVAQTVNIFDIQGQQAASPYLGTTVRTQGVVTAVYGNVFAIQDGSGAWNGLWATGAFAANVGDSYDLQGDVTESWPGFEGTTVLSNVQVLSTNPGVVPGATVTTSGAAFTEAQEGVLTQVLDAQCLSVDLGGGVWRIDDGSGPGRVGELGYDSSPTLGTRYDVAGPLRETGAGLQMEPRVLTDIVWSGDSFAPVLLAISTNGTTAVRATFSEAVDPATAQLVANYAITGPMSVAVASAVLDGLDPTTVILSTPSLSAGTYSLTVDGVEDLFGNAASGLAGGFTINIYGPPAGYYSAAIGLTGDALRTALHSIIAGHNSVSYAATLTVFQTSDDKPNGKVWDIYSDVPGGTSAYEYTFGVDNGSSASAEGQGYNREHSWPRSWFGGAVAPMNSDLFQLYPTDIYLNSIRGSFAYGEVSAPDFVSTNGSQRGPNTYPGYIGTVFEPIDAYKGDLARSYFYMTARYTTEDSSWPGGPMTSGADLLPWAESMLYSWHLLDPVSDKERERNHVIFGVQNNRNPFIDHPEYVATMLNLVTAVDELPAVIVRLRPNFPNPFASSTTIAYDLSRSEPVRIAIFDLRGRRVRALFSGTPGIGPHLLQWNGLDQSGRAVATGTYFYRVEVGNQRTTRSMILVR